MKILIVGSGGREHTLAWKLAQSQTVDQIYCAPGNGGIAQMATCVDLSADNLSGLADFAEQESIDLTVVGPEAPLVAGIADLFPYMRPLKQPPAWRAASRLPASCYASTTSIISALKSSQMRQRRKLTCAGRARLLW